MNTVAPPIRHIRAAMADPESPRTAVVQILADTLFAMHLQKSAPGDRTADRSRTTGPKSASAVRSRNHLIIVSEPAPVSTKGGPERTHTRPERCES